jgi:hypothetical protein
MVHFTLTITKRRAFTIILAITAIMVIDSTIINYFGFNIRELPTSSYVGIFVTFAILFVVIVIILISFVKAKDSEPRLKRGLAVKSSFIIVSLALCSLIGVLIIIIQPTMALRSYSILSLFAAVYVSHISALFFIIYLVITLVHWLITKKNKILSLYAISFTLTAITIITSLIYATYVLSYQPSNIRPSSIHNSLIALPRSELAIYFGPTLDAISVISFVSVWMASAVLLNTYSSRIGKVKYWMIISVPLVYFLFPFEKSFVDIFQPLTISSPVLFGAIYFLFFSATKQIGALFFSLAFITASTLIAKGEMQKYLLITAIGIAVLFGSIEIDTLLYATYPPFDLVTISFMPMGAYLVFTGITVSATLLARDKELRKDFYKTAMSQLSLLKTIGVTQMERELIKSYKSVEKRTRLEEIETTSNFDSEDVREILRDVLNELYSKPKIKSEF